MPTSQKIKSEGYSLQDYYLYAKREIETDDLFILPKVDKVIGGAWVFAQIWISDDELMIDEAMYDEQNEK